jgi:hypothetical protein
MSLEHETLSKQGNHLGHFQSKIEQEVTADNVILSSGNYWPYNFNT